MKTVARNFTAENWEASDRISGTPAKHDVVYVDCDDRGETIAAVWLPCLIGREQDEVEEEALALARVIAAAPAMLRVLSAMNHMGGDDRGGYCICPRNDGSAHDGEHSTCCMDARRAIAKALGHA